MIDILLIDFYLEIFFFYYLDKDASSSQPLSHYRLLPLNQFKVTMVVLVT